MFSQTGPVLTFCFLTYCELNISHTRCSQHSHSWIPSILPCCEGVKCRFSATSAKSLNLSVFCYCSSLDLQRHSIWWEKFRFHYAKHFILKFHIMEESTQLFKFPFLREVPSLWKCFLISVVKIFVFEGIFCYGCFLTCSWVKLNVVTVLSIPICNLEITVITWKYHIVRFFIKPPSGKLLIYSVFFQSFILILHIKIIRWLFMIKIQMFVKVIRRWIPYSLTEEVVFHIQTALLFFFLILFSTFQKHIRSWTWYDSSKLCISIVIQFHFYYSLLTFFTIFLVVYPFFFYIFNMLSTTITQLLLFLLDHIPFIWNSTNILLLVVKSCSIILCWLYTCWVFLFFQESTPGSIVLCWVEVLTFHLYILLLRKSKTSLMVQHFTAVVSHSYFPPYIHRLNVTGLIRFYLTVFLWKEITQNHSVEGWIILQLHSYKRNKSHWLQLVLFY